MRVDAVMHFIFSMCVCMGKGHVLHICCLSAKAVVGS